MASSEYQQTANKDFGESLKYDPTFRGPLHKRSCTDVICLLLFICFVLAWVAVGIFAFTHGDPGRLLSPTDSEGRRCGIDDEVREKPYLFFFDLTKCAAPNAVITGCPTPQVCVKKCPTESFVFAVDSKIPGSNWRSKMICKIDMSVSNESEAEKLIEEQNCAQYYIPSKEDLASNFIFKKSAVKVSWVHFMDISTST